MPSALRGIAAALAVVALAGCGSGSKPPAQAAPCVSPAAQRALKSLAADTVAIRSAANLPTQNTLDGNPAINAATDHFLSDVQTAPIDNLTRNRLIDHAIGALVGECQQCFEALEADRPIPAIAHNSQSTSCKS